MSSTCPTCGDAIGAPLDGCKRCAPGPAHRAPNLLLAALFVAGGTLVMSVVAVFAARAIPPPAPIAADSANEAAARDRLERLQEAQARFLATDPDRDGVRDHGTLDELVAAALLEPGLARGPRSGYVFHCEPVALGPGFAATATPLSARADRYLGADESGGRFASRTTPFRSERGRLVLPPDAVRLDRLGPP